jgi:hypothetical protein
MAASDLDYRGKVVGTNLTLPQYIRAKKLLTCPGCGELREIAPSGLVCVLCNSRLQRASRRELNECAEVYEVERLTRPRSVARQSGEAE